MSSRPGQGLLDDCWLMAPMLAIHETAPRLLADALAPHDDGTATVRLPGLGRCIRVVREFPVDARGRFLGAREAGSSLTRASAIHPGWPGALEKAVAIQVSGGYQMLQRGFARTGFALLTGRPSRTLLRFPDVEQLARLLAQGRAICASTHPFSARVRIGTNPLPRNHVFAVVGADPEADRILLRNPTDPERIMRIDPRRLRLGFLSIDVSEVLRREP